MGGTTARPRSKLREIVFRTLAAIIAVLAVWAFLRSPASFLQSIGSGWQRRFGAPVFVAALGAYALFGERLAYRMLALLTQALALPTRLLERLLARVVEAPPTLSPGPPEARLPGADEGTSPSRDQEGRGSPGA
jgi:hypothetical protein